MIAASLAVLAAAPFIGGHGVGIDAVLRPDSGDPASMIFWQLRLPRACMAWIAGAGLAVGGMVFQAMFRNDLATPYTLGVSSGASLGATLALRLGAGALLPGLSGVTAGAMAGALIATGLVYGISRLRRDFTAASMLLAGVAVNFFFSSLILLIQYSANFHDTFRILRWLMGGIQVVGPGMLPGAALFVTAGCVLAAAMARELNLLSTGEEIALSRGVDAGTVKTLLFVSTSVMVGSIVSLCGPVGFVGLMCPHICRLLVGPDHRRLFPATLFFGGAFLVVADTVARTIMAPTELPVGIITALLGGPFFLWLLVKRGPEDMPAP
jgi:iron complex transport system permease protein